MNGQQSRQHSIKKTFGAEDGHQFTAVNFEGNVFEHDAHRTVSDHFFEASGRLHLYSKMQLNERNDKKKQIQIKYLAGMVDVVELEDVLVGDVKSGHLSWPSRQQQLRAPS